MCLGASDRFDGLGSGSRNFCDRRSAMRGLILGSICGLLFGGFLGIGAIQMSGDIADSLTLHEIVC